MRALVIKLEEECFNLFLEFGWIFLRHHMTCPSNGGDLESRNLFLHAILLLRCNKLALGAYYELSWHSYSLDVGPEVSVVTRHVWTTNRLGYNCPIRLFFEAMPEPAIDILGRESRVPLLKISDNLSFIIESGWDLLAPRPRDGVWRCDVNEYEPLYLVGVLRGEDHPHPATDAVAN